MIDGSAMLGLMNQPKYVRDAIAAETRVYKLDEPPKYFGKGIAGH
jgi:spermidine synthase